jgi:hypothetical protein
VTATARTRRAAGTQTFTDVLRTMFGGKRPNPAQDIADFGAGAGLEVTCFLRQADSTSRAQYGTFVLRRGEQLAWRPWPRWRGEGLTLVGPVAFSRSDDTPRAPQFAALLAVSASGTFRIQVPVVDVELLAHAAQHRPATD